jgi:5-(carboxyamino)imidazole ribonucleotide mutase
MTGNSAGVTAPSPVVGVIMGSDSDWPVMSAAADILRQFEVGFEVSVVSAHRTPDRMLGYARAAAGRGLRVIIAGAGGAAHLPGMVASATVLPVIGVPVPLARLDGLDSLLSIVQMPAGIPVATVSIGGAANAALLAVRILASAAVGGDDSGPSSRKLAEQLAAYAAGLEEMVLEKDAKLQQQLAR